MSSDLSNQRSDLDVRLRRFRIASRELFNTYFALSEPWKNSDAAWQSAENFSEIEALMFKHMVLVPENLLIIRYGQAHPEIKVGAKAGIQSLPAKINREISSGYWDFDLSELPSDVTLGFISFFDWSDIDIRDYEFVKVIVQKSPSDPRIIGKQALVRPINVVFTRN